MWLDNLRCAHVIYLTGLVLAAGGAGAQAPASQADDKAKTAPMKKIELSLLSNEELLKQASAIYDKASRDYLAQRRILASAEARLDDVRTQTDEASQSTNVTPADSQKQGEKAAKKAVDEARAKQDKVRHTLKLVETQKALLGRVLGGIETCQSSAGAFQNVLDDLRAYAFEAKLRVKDGSLGEDKVPGDLKADVLDKKKRELHDDVARLSKKSADMQRGQEAVARLLDDATKAALAADADVVEASRNLVREQRRHDLEKTYAGKKQDDMMAELERMVEEGIGLKGTYELALRKFEMRKKDAGRLHADFELLKQPQAKIPQLNRAEDVETAGRSIQELISFYNTKLKKGEEQRGALTVLARDGGEFEADAAVSDEHLFKMQVLANLLRKNGVADDKLPEKARAASLDPAAVRQQQSAAAVRAATEKAKTELTLLERQLAEAGAAKDAAVKQLANLKESRDVILAALKWENQLKDMTGPQVIEAFNATRKELTDRLGKLKSAAAGYDSAGAVAAEAKIKLDGVRDPFLRTAEEQGQAEKQKLSAELRKEAGLERAVKDGAAVASAPTETAKKVDTDKKPPPDTRTELDKATDHVMAVQQLLAGRVRVVDEQAALKKKLLSAQSELEKKAKDYVRALADARLEALRLNAAAVDLKKRYGMGDISGDAIPDGITDALRLELRTKLDSTMAAVLNALDQLQQERAKLVRADPDGDALAKATGELLTLVGKRLDLLADWKKLAADYRREKSARPPSELKRLEQRAADRQAEESSGWDALLALDASKNAKTLAELLDSYYIEVIEIEGKEENLKKQREKVEQMLELTRQEAAAVTLMLPVLARSLTQFEAAREEDTVLVRARLRPDKAEELLKAYRAKTGRMLSKPLPLADKDKSEKVDELAALLFDRMVMLEAAKRWSDVLAARLAAAGIKSEAGVYQDELAQMQAVSSANVRRLQTLTGSDTGGAATAGEIATTRDELNRVRSAGVKRVGVTIGIILLAAYLVPRILLWTLRRALGISRGDEGSLVLTAFGAILKVIVWISAIAMILSLFGFNVTAIVAGLGIGGLAIGLAAQPMLGDVIGAVVIFAERRFKIGDVIRLDRHDPARVVGLTWRSTQVKNAEGVLISIPNRKVAEAIIENLTRPTGTYDSLNVSVTTSLGADKVLSLIQGAMSECKQLAADRAMSVVELTQKAGTRTITYRCSWLMPDYEVRNKTRDEVFERISTALSHEDMAGAEINLA
jgi:small-conductance mechanosensitive channel